VSRCRGARAGLRAFTAPVHPAGIGTSRFARGAHDDQTALLLLTLLLASCMATVPREVSAASPASRSLPASRCWPATRHAPARVDILALDQPMRDFLDRHVDRRANGHLRLQQLVHAVIDKAASG